MALAPSYPFPDVTRITPTPDKSRKPDLIWINYSIPGAGCGLISLCGLAALGLESALTRRESTPFLSIIQRVVSSQMTDNLGDIKGRKWQMHGTKMRAVF